MPPLSPTAIERARENGLSEVSKKLKKELQDQLEICQYKINPELDFVRKELQPL